VVCCIPSNQLELIQFPEKEGSTPKKTETQVATTELLPFDGHRKLVRGIAFSSDKTAILTASADCFKIWNR
jgi:WD40 repeat protein